MQGRYCYMWEVNMFVFLHATTHHITSHHTKREQIKNGVIFLFFSLLFFSIFLFLKMHLTKSQCKNIIFLILSSTNREWNLLCNHSLGPFLSQSVCVCFIFLFLNQAKITLRQSENVTIECEAKEWSNRKG